MSNVIHSIDIETGRQPRAGAGPASRAKAASGPAGQRRKARSTMGKTAGPASPASPEAAPGRDAPAPVPDIGDLFFASRAPGDWPRSFSVSGWLRRQDDPPPGAPPAGPDWVPLEWCRRDQAEYVAGFGRAAVIARTGDIRLRGRQSSNTRRTEMSRRHAARSAGRPLGRPGSSMTFIR